MKIEEETVGRFVGVRCFHFAGRSLIFEVFVLAIKKHLLNTEPLEATTKH